MPFMSDLPNPDAVATTLPSRFLLTVAAAYRRWRIYWPKGAELRAELEAKGFEHLHTIPHPRTPFMVMRLTEQKARVERPA